MRIILAVVVAFIVSGCSQRPPTSPSVIDSSAPLVFPTATIHIVGIVSDDFGAPVADAKITASGFGRQTSGATNSSGLYEVAVSGAPLPLPLFGSPIYVLAEKPGYEPDQEYVAPASEHMTRDLQLYRQVKISAGQLVRLAVAPGDPFCGISDEWWCRTVRVTAPRDGTMTVEVIPQDPDVALKLQTRPFPFYNCCSSRLSMAVPAGREVTVDVLLAWDPRSTLGPQAFTLRTSLD